jgi:hypothetical protein
MPFKLIPVPTVDTDFGCIFKFLNINTIGQFGEFYTTPAPCTHTKGWKCHTSATLYLFPLLGSVIFFLADEHPNSPSLKIKSLTLSSPPLNSQRRSEYSILSISPGTWFAFRGFDYESTSHLLSVSSILHKPTECLSFPFSTSIS